MATTSDPAPERRDIILNLPTTTTGTNVFKHPKLTARFQHTSEFRYGLLRIRDSTKHHTRYDRVESIVTIGQLLPDSRN